MTLHLASLWVLATFVILSSSAVFIADAWSRDGETEVTTIVGVLLVNGAALAMTALRGRQAAHRRAVARNFDAMTGPRRPSSPARSPGSGGHRRPVARSHW